MITSIKIEKILVFRIWAATALLYSLNVNGKIISSNPQKLNILRPGEIGATPLFTVPTFMAR